MFRGRFFVIRILFAKGDSFNAIAVKLYLFENTVKAHMCRINQNGHQFCLKKLGCLRVDQYLNGGLESVL